MPNDKRDDISFSTKGEPKIDIQPKQKLKPEKETIEILTPAESIRKLWTHVKPLHLLTVCLTIISGVILIGLFQPPKEPVNDLVEQTPEPLSSFEEADSPNLPFIVERQTLKVDLLEAMVRDSMALPFSWDVISELEEILSWSIGLRNIKKGDVIYCIWEVDEQGNKKKEIAGLALEVSALDTSLMAIRYKAKEQAIGYYDGTGRPMKRQFLQSPVRYGRVSSRYNLTRMNPALLTIKPHRGTDFAAPMGEPIYALGDGVIEKQGFTAGNGNFVKLVHDSIYKTAYLHMSKFPSSQQIGDTVSQGDIIGYVGSTGYSTGPHVCLRFWRRDRQQDFVHQHPYLPAPATLPYLENKRLGQRRDSMLWAVRLTYN